MTTPLSHEDHLELLACIQELHKCRSLVDFPQHALRAMAPLIRSNLSAFNEVNVPRGRIFFVTDRQLENENELRQSWALYSSQHPLVRYVAETGDGQAIKCSDFLSETQYHRLDLYRTFYRYLGAEDQFSITIRSDSGVIIAMAFNRERRDFTESDRVKLNLLRPHLLQAYANVEELAGHLEEKKDLQTALRETGQGMIALHTDCRAQHATPGVVDCLLRYFPESDPLEALPQPLTEWLDAGGTPAFVLHAADASLIVRNPRGTDRRILLVSEERRTGGPLERLTARETEVLHWVAEGKSNPEIAMILGVAAGTVKQHVEHILTKLGAKNRAAAAALVRECPGIAPR